MLKASISLPVLPRDGPLRLTPTDVSQFVRLEQCERYLRFRLVERAGQKFMEEYDVIPQRIAWPVEVPGRAGRLPPGRSSARFRGWQAVVHRRSRHDAGAARPGSTRNRKKLVSSLRRL